MEIQLLNPAFDGKNIDLTVTLPAEVTYLNGRVGDSASKPVLNGQELSFPSIVASYQSPITATFTVEVRGDVGNEPKTLAFSTKAKWGNYSLESVTEIIVNGRSVYLPLIAR